MLAREQDRVKREAEILKEMKGDQNKENMLLENQVKYIAKFVKKMLLLTVTD